MSLLRRGEPLSPEEQAQKKQLRSERVGRVNAARAATRGMKPPEPQRGLMVSVALAAAAVYSYLSTDVETVTTTVKHKTVTGSEAITHPEAAIILFVLAVAAGVTIYWRRRLVTGVAFMLTAALGLGTPFPKAAADLQYVVFLLPAVFVLWMLIFRMNKEQKDLLAKTTPKARSAGPARNTSRRAAGQASAAGSRRGAKVEPTTAAGRPRPPSSGRYTPPRAKPRAAQAAQARAAQRKT